MKVEIFITLKKAILDPQGKALTTSLHHLGFEEVKDVRVGKYLEVDMQDATEDQARQKVQAMCDQLLANPVIENVRYEFTR
jgi:phosphoribosylformylglycinamidine synthase